MEHPSWDTVHFKGTFEATVTNKASGCSLGDATQTSLLSETL